MDMEDLPETNPNTINSVLLPSANIPIAYRIDLKTNLTKNSQVECKIRLQYLRDKCKRVKCSIKTEYTKIVYECTKLELKLEKVHRRSTSYIICLNLRTK